MSLADEHRIIREGAVIGAIQARRHIAVAGGDRASYLHGLLTNDIQALVAGSGCYAAWLTPQGRMLTDMHVLESGDMILLDVPAAEAESTLARLDQFLFTEDVRLESLDGSLTSVCVHGPAAARALQTAVDGLDDAAAWTDYRVSRGVIQSTPVVVARIDQLGVPGYRVYVPPDAEADLKAALARAGAHPVGESSLEAARIEAGYPLFGVDMTPETIPLEAGIEGRAISLTKGCYVGQEVIIRALHRGHGRVAKRLVGLRIEGGVPGRGAKVFFAEREIGFVTSAAQSPLLGAIGLGYVHRDFVEPGTAVQVQDGDARVPATVSGRPLR
jgi:folate-binding protein YgfZ